MAIPVNSTARWKERYLDEIRRNLDKAEKENENAIVKTRQLTDKEKKEIFENRNYDYIKEIEV
jgi:hypothetical protein